MHAASTLAWSDKVKDAATVLSDRNVLAMLATGDLTAIDALYHMNCLASFFYRAEKENNKDKGCSNFMSESDTKNIVFAELVSHIAED